MLDAITIGEFNQVFNESKEAIKANDENDKEKLEDTLNHYTSFLRPSKSQTQWLQLDSESIDLYTHYVVVSGNTWSWVYLKQKELILSFFRNVKVSYNLA